MKLLNDLLTFLQQHEATATVISAWISREVIVIWPKLVESWPFITKNGGVFGISWIFFFGQSAVEQKQETQQPTQILPTLGGH